MVGDAVERGGNGKDGSGKDGSEETADPPGVPATPRTRARSAALWGLVGGFAFLVLAQGYLLFGGGLPFRYAGLFALAGAITVTSGGIAYAIEHQLHAKRRT